ncbi:MAG: FHA domain-containing protein [Elusimicrobia bacterium]|nr:FHA domain-containing protein [Elusimicrobiota bacterium]
MPKLLLKFNAAVIKEIPLDKPAVTVGRKADNDVVIDNPAISGHHCKIVQKGDTYYVEDLESTNGTFVNEKRIVKSGLHDQDVVGVAKHALVFIDDRPAPEEAGGADKTMVLAPDKQEALAKAAAAANAPSAKAEPAGWMRVLKGVVAKSEYELKGISTYIGKSDRVQIPIADGGFFNRAPEVAASVHKKAEGWVLKAVKEGYPVLNGQKVADTAPLTDGDIIECGGTTLQFFLK